MTAGDVANVQDEASWRFVCGLPVTPLARLRAPRARAARSSASVLTQN